MFSHHPARAWRVDPHARSRGPLLAALGVALATVGCAPPGPRSTERDVQTFRRSVAVAGLRQGAGAVVNVSYLQSGDALGPRVILVHGTPGSASGWADYVLQPPAGLEMLAIDRPGFGDSGPVGAMTTLADQAAAVAALLPDDGRPVVLLGHSLGGPVVARVALDHPGRVQAVVLLAASMDPALEKIHPVQWVGAWPGLRWALPRAIRNANAELMALKSELVALAAQLQYIRVRVVIVHGTADDLVPFANVAFMQARLTAARCVKTLVLEGRNHFLPWNSADVVRAAINQALEPAC